MRRAVDDLFSDQAGGRSLQDGSSRGERSRPGTVYFACKPKPDIAAEMALAGNRLCGKLGLPGKVSPGVLHATLCSIGHFPDLSDERVEAACKAAGALAAKAFEMALDRVRTYPNGQQMLPFVAFSENGVPGAEFLRYELMGELRRVGFTFPKKLPAPHMTFCYDRRSIAEQAIEPIRWMVRDFVLIHSIQGEGRHVLLGQWQLCG
jgi:2'-5' RNA ligase